METAAKILVILAFLGGTFLASLDHTHVNWDAFVPVVLAGVVGVYLVKRAQRMAARDVAVISVNRQELTQSLENIVQNLEALDGKKDEIPAYEVRFDIDRLFRDDLMRFADARESLKHIYGLETYANIMSSFAAGERYLNRVWSASTDGYVDEVLTYIEKSLGQFKEAKAVLAAAVAL